MYGPREENGNKKCPLDPGFFYSRTANQHVLREPGCFTSKVFFCLGELKLHFDVKYKVAVVYSGS